ncbi:MAG: LysM peptidoglycan-binding domain-containing protein [Rhodoglobus sp.]
MSTAVIAPGYGFTPARTAQRATSSVPRLRLTKRGRAVLMFLAATPLVIGALFFALNGGGATASHEGSAIGFEYVTVESGQTLWQLAETLAPAADPREVIAEIMQLNLLESADVYAGQELAVPAAYAP